MLNNYLTRLYPGIFSSAVFIVILWLTLAPHPLPETEISFFPHCDKVVHALMFGGMAFALFFDRALWRLRRNDKRLHYIRCEKLLILLSVVVFGGCIELLQTFMALGRGGDIFDFFADVIGIVVFVLVSPHIVASLLNRR